MATPLPDVSLSDWAVLAVVAEGPTHGWPVVRELRAGGGLGRIWTVGRPVVYRSIATLTTLGLVEECGETTGGRGPQRTIVRATRSGRGALRRWLLNPVEHVREVRTEFLLKLAILDRSGRDPSELIERQRAALAPVFRANAGAPASDGFDGVLSAWRREQSAAVERFFDSLAAPPVPRRTGRRTATSD